MESMTNTAATRTAQTVGVAKDRARRIQARADALADKMPRPVRCLACCCCWTASGLRELLTSGSTLEIAVGFVVGEQFGAIIYTFTETIVAPLFFSVFDVKNLDVRSFPGFLLLTNPNDAEIISAPQARESGCRVINWDEAFQGLLSFLVTLTTLYWLMSILQRDRQKHDSQEVTDGHLAGEALSEDIARDIDRSAKLFPAQDKGLRPSKTCVDCCEAIHVQARRCPYCTSYQHETDRSASLLAGATADLQAPSGADNCQGGPPLSSPETV